MAFFFSVAAVFRKPGNFRNFDFLIILAKKVEKIDKTFLASCFKLLSTFQSYSDVLYLPYYYKTSHKGVIWPLKDCKNGINVVKMYILQICRFTLLTLELRKEI